MKSTASQMSLFYVEADQCCMAPISKQKGRVYNLCGSKSVGVGACSLASHVKQRDPRFKIGKGVLGIGVPNGKKVDQAAVFSEVLAQPLPSFLRPSGGEKADERFVELIGARASFLWSVASFASAFPGVGDVSGVCYAQRFCRRRIKGCVVGGHQRQGDCAGGAGSRGGPDNLGFWDPTEARLEGRAGGHGGKAAHRDALGPRRGSGQAR
eukprot:scaffold12966_cov38-Attheya_sp.AAC.4